jgi:hypothetical protein
MLIAELFLGKVLPCTWETILYEQASRLHEEEVWLSWY